MMLRFPFISFIICLLENILHIVVWLGCRGGRGSGNIARWRPQLQGMTIVCLPVFNAEGAIRREGRKPAGERAGRYERTCRVYLHSGPPRIHQKVQNERLTQCVLIAFVLFLCLCKESLKKILSPAAVLVKMIH